MALNVIIIAYFLPMHHALDDEWRDSSALLQVKTDLTRNGLDDSMSFNAYIEKCKNDATTEDHIQRIGMANSSNAYLKRRADLVYYRDLFCAVKFYGQHAKTVLDVGSSDPPFVLSLNWIPHKHIVAPYLVGSQDCKSDSNETCDLGNGITSDMMDFMAWHGSAFDIVLCSQVAEHVDDPTAFVRKLIGTGKTLILSVPYKWHDWKCEHCHHKSHNINETTIRSWAGQPETALRISEERDETQRIIMAFRNEAL